MASPLTATISLNTQLQPGTGNNFSLDVTSVAGWANVPGYIWVTNSAGALQIVGYTGVSATPSPHFTGCTGGTGTVLAGATVIQAYSTTTTSGYLLPAGTIGVASLTNFSTATPGLVWLQNANGTWQAVYYTGTGTLTLTGCTGGSGTINSGSAVVLGIHTVGRNGVQTIPAAGSVALPVTSATPFFSGAGVGVGTAGILGALTQQGFQSFRTRTRRATLPS